MSNSIQAAIEREIGCQIAPVRGSEAPHHNTHYRGEFSSGQSIFVKVIADHRRYYTAEVNVAYHLGNTGFPTPRLLNHGVVGSRWYWLAYEWHDFVAFSPTRENVERAGRLLGMLHLGTAGLHDPHLREYPDIDQLVCEQAARIAEFDTALAARVRRLRTDLIRHGAAAGTGQRSLLHGDVGWRNLQLDTNERLWLIDFEHAAIGSPLLDFAKLWDRELWDSGMRQAFLEGYRVVYNLHLEGGAETIDAVRLWAAAGIFPYARATSDSAFEEHACTILDRLTNRIRSTHP